MAQRKGIMTFKMKRYVKTGIVKEKFDRSTLPFHDLPENFKWFQVKKSSKMSQLFIRALLLLDDPTVNVLVLTGTSIAARKTFSFAGFLEKHTRLQYQESVVATKKFKEYWDPIVKGLKRFVIKREYPVIHILLSVGAPRNENQLE